MFDKNFDSNQANEKSSVALTIYENDIRDRVTGSFYAGVIQGLLVYAGFEGTKVEFKMNEKDSCFDIEFADKFKNQIQN